MMSSHKLTTIQIDVRVVGKQSFRGMVADVRDILDDMESGTTSIIELRERIESVHTRFEASLRADCKKAVM